MVLDLNWISITITYTFQLAVPLKIHLCNNFDGNGASNLKRQCDFFPALWGCFLVWSAFWVYLSSWHYNQSSVQLANPDLYNKNWLCHWAEAEGGAYKSIYISEVHSFSGASSVALDSFL